MSSHVALGAIAVLLGVFVGVALFVPFVAVEYRRYGRLSPGRIVVWIAALCYFWAIWSYTLLPLPVSEDFTCAGMVTDPSAAVRDLREAWVESVGSVRGFATAPATVQLVLNVFLFVPLGFFLRIVAGRGVVVAGLVGLGTSLAIEFTQLTGVWGAYHCAYRVFDVDDLVANTLGAVIGALVSLLVPHRLWGTRGVVDADAPHPVTRGRRLLAMFCDWLAISLLVVLGAAVSRMFMLGILRLDPDVVGLATWPETVSILTVALVWFLVVLATGSTPGDLAVRIEFVRRHGNPTATRVLRYLTGSGGYLLCVLFPTVLPIDLGLSPFFAGATVLLALATHQGTGLPGIITGAELVDRRGPVLEGPAEATPPAGAPPH